MSEELLTVEEVTVKYSVTESRVRKWIKDGLETVGRWPTRIPSAALDAYVRRFQSARGEVDPGARKGVYFVQSGGFIKIGVAFDVRARWAGERTDNPHPVERLGYIPVRGDTCTMAYALERELHERFASYRHRGEWFRANAGLLEFIHDNAKPWPA